MKFLISLLMIITTQAFAQTANYQEPFITCTEVSATKDDFPFYEVIIHRNRVQELGINIQLNIRHDSSTNFIDEFTNAKVSGTSSHNTKNYSAHKSFNQKQNVSVTIAKDGSAHLKYSGDKERISINMNCQGRLAK